MVRQYVQVTDSQRRDLVRLIHEEGCSIAKASKVTGIPYDNAKAINRTYLREKRIHKINYRLRYQKKTLMAYSANQTGFNLNKLQLKTLPMPVSHGNQACSGLRDNSCLDYQIKSGKFISNIPSLSGLVINNQNTSQKHT